MPFIYDTQKDNQKQFKIFCQRTGKMIRYDKLDTYCTFRDDEDDSIDVAVLSDKRIYIACEADEGKLRGYIIYPGKTNIDGFYFNKFD